MGPVRRRISNPSSALAVPQYQTSWTESLPRVKAASGTTRVLPRRMTRVATDGDGTKLDTGARVDHLAVPQGARVNPKDDIITRFLPVSPFPAPRARMQSILHATTRFILCPGSPFFFLYSRGGPWVRGEGGSHSRSSRLNTHRRCGETRCLLPPLFGTSVARGLHDAYTNELRASRGEDGAQEIQCCGLWVTPDSRYSDPDVCHEVSPGAE